MQGGAEGGLGGHMLIRKAVFNAILIAHNLRVHICALNINFPLAGTTILQQATPPPDHHNRPALIMQSLFIPSRATSCLGGVRGSSSVLILSRPITCSPNVHASHPARVGPSARVVVSATSVATLTAQQPVVGASPVQSLGAATNLDRVINSLLKVGCIFKENIYCICLPTCPATWPCKLCWGLNALGTWMHSNH